MKILVNPLLLESIKIIGAKRTMLNHQKDKLNIIVVGSSHGDYGFNPKFFPESFNLCCRSQDLKHSFLIYKHITKNYPNIKNIVICYSIFSPGNIMENSPTEKFISPALNEFFNLGIEYEDEELNFEFNKIKGRFSDVTVDSNGFMGFLPDSYKTFFPESYGAINRANDHLKFNKKIEANLFLIKFLLLAKHLQHKVCIVVPPVRSDYKKATGGNFNVLFKSLIEITNDFYLNYDIDLINGFDSNLFRDEFFGDYDHLLPLGKGTEILSRAIFNKFNGSVLE
ncbi:MAG: hypothetical protein ACJAVF_004644 [Paraglaciecola sp.]|jgi:hypothetical protein